MNIQFRYINLSESTCFCIKKHFGTLAFCHRIGWIETLSDGLKKDLRGKDIYFVWYFLFSLFESSDQIDVLSSLQVHKYIGNFCKSSDRTSFRRFSVREQIQNSDFLSLGGTGFSLTDDLSGRHSLLQWM